MLKPNEKMYVDCVLCRTAEDSHVDGESLNQSRSWTDRDLQMDRTVGYATVGEALAAVCKSNCFDYKKENWENFGVEASLSEIEDWKLGKKRLRNCRVSAYLEVRTEPRTLTEDEAKSWS